MPKMDKTHIGRARTNSVKEQNTFTGLDYFRSFFFTNKYFLKSFISYLSATSFFF